MANQTKREIINAVAAAVHIPKKKAQALLKTLSLLMIETLKREGRLRIFGFGTFVVKHRAGKKGTNPKTKAVLLLPPKDYVVFRPSKRLKERINPK
jgi:nucleoid DNA-binding protein